MSQRPVRIAGFGLAWLCAFAALLHAERAPLPPARLVEESDLVLRGQILSLNIGTERSHVESGFGNYDWAIDLTLRIQSVEKGGFDESDTIVVRCFRIKTRKSVTATISVSGNHPIPEVGAEVRAHLYRQGDLWRVVFPNGLAPLQGHTPLADATEIRALNPFAYTYWLPIEGWASIAVVGTAALLGLWLVRRLRRPHPAELLTGLMVAAVLAAGLLRAEDWPMLGRDKTRNAVSPEKGAPLVWDAGSGRNICIDPTRRGDVSLELDDGPGKGKPNPNSAIVWHLDSFGRTMSQVAVHDGLVMAAGLEGHILCLDAVTGRQHWTHDTNGRVVSSPLIVDDKVYVGTDEGEMFVFALTKEKSLLLTHEFRGSLWSSPVFANGVLYLAVNGELLAIQQGTSSPPPPKPSKQ